MGILAPASDERIKEITFPLDSISVVLMDGRTITVPLIWYPRLADASLEDLEQWEIIDSGYGIHWEKLDEDLSVEGLLRGSPAPTGTIPEVKVF
jgi:hypothetical protein